MDLIFGIDLGDGETVISCLQGNDGIDLFAKSYDPTPIITHRTSYVKRNNGIFSFEDSDNDDTNYLDVYSNFKHAPTSVKNEDYLLFEQMIIDYCNLCFQEDIKKCLKMYAQGEINTIIYVFGHPTNWSEQDIDLYEKIIKKTEFGNDIVTINGEQISTSLILEKESRAAFLHYQNCLSDFDQKKNRLLIDIGSSTIDITAVSGSDNLSIYNGGENFLGARFFDYLLRDYILYTKLSDKHPEILYIYENNYGAKKQLLVNVRIAKENYFNAIKENKNKSIRIDDKVLNDEMPLRLSLQEITECFNKPVKKCLLNNVFFEPELQNICENDTWTDLFAKFLVLQRDILEGQNFEINEIIFSGHASLMYFIPEIVQRIFGNKISIEYDQSPAVAIANGLVLCHVFNARGERFQEEITDKISDVFPDIISEKIEELSKTLAQGISSYVCDVSKKELIKWKEGKTKTLNDVNNQILERCRSAPINEYIHNTQIQKISIWYESVVKEVMTQLTEDCKKYHIKNINPEINSTFTVEELNISESINGILESFNFNLLSDSIENSLPEVIGETLGLVIVLIQAAIELVGWIVLKILDALGVTSKDESESVIRTKLKSVVFPQSFRNTISTANLISPIEEKQKELEEKIEAEIMKEENLVPLFQNVSNSIMTEVGAKIREIRYVIADMDK